MMIIPLLIAAVAIGFTLLYASVLDIRDRRVPFKTWYPMLVISVPAAVLFYLTLSDWTLGGRYLIAALIFSGFFYLCASFGLFGGADAWALIFISLLIPTFPAQPLLGYTATGFFPFTVLVNSLIFALIAPVGIFLINRIRGNRGPLICQFMGFPVNSADLTRTYGFVMEEFSLEGGALQRRYFGFFETLKMMLGGRQRVYTRNLRLHPGDYVEETRLYRKAGTVWISYAVPFIVPITAGLLMSLTVGDPIYWLLARMIAG
ncbi:A24 family peptidase [Methanosphaerula palustris]|uniref:Peptidase A24A prepilin type IV n=1 Tax=Methanosphaerula palustris (strain ATCC BAA-1556 / DSM 19958 / E1-9c) TaxID=521011 RepID=B8GFK6_METPE|nr:A24 family peptidase [Methanosphaerula palustris]ACL16054.1 peptidase A24A prepilin type IV [Methanosphaerula palustris E1-9c]